MINLGNAQTQEQAQEQRRKEQELTGEAFRSLMVNRGLNPPEHIEPGRLHRFPGEGDHSGMDGWCRLFEDEVGGVFGDWSTGLYETWQAKRDRPFTDDKRRAFRRQCEESKRHIAEQKEAENQVAACQAQERWDRAAPATNHPYIDRKRLPPGELRQDGNRLLIPMSDRDGKLWALQVIAPDGDKKYWPKGCRTAGCFHFLGDLSAEPDAPIHGVEGWATGAAIHESTGHPVIVAFSAGQLAAVVDVVLQDCPGRKVVICADDDQKPGTDANPGIEAARGAASGKEDVYVAVPALGEKADFWDVWDKQGAEAVQVAIARAERVVESSIPSKGELEISTEEWTAARLTPDCIIQDYMFADVMVTAAQGGTGKTTLCLRDMIHIRLKRPLYGLEVMKPGWSLFVTKEDSREILVARTREIAGAMDLTAAEVEQVRRGVIIFDVCDLGEKLINLRDGNIEISSFVDAVIARFRDNPPVLLVIDPTISFGVGESKVNDNEDGLMQAARKIRNGLGCCVRFIHHVGKANAREKTLDQYSGRGGSGLPDGSRMVQVMLPWTPGDTLTPPASCTFEPETSITVIARPKLSYSPANLPLIWVKRTGWIFEHFIEVFVSDEDKESGVRDQVELFIRSCENRGVYHNRASLESAKGEMGLPRNKIRDAVNILIAEGRLIEKELPIDQQNTKRKTYLGVRRHSAEFKNQAENEV